MTFSFSYIQEPERLIPAVEIDSRASNPLILGKIGSVIKAFTDQKLALVSDGVIPYKIENNTGNLAGYFLVKVSGDSASMLSITLRPAFKPFSTQIVVQINNFILNGNYKFDAL